jgi:phage-related minor tail protein
MKLSTFTRTTGLALAAAALCSLVACSGNAGNPLAADDNPTPVAKIVRNDDSTVVRTVGREGISQRTNRHRTLLARERQRLEQARIEQARIEQARIEQARIEQARIEQARIEQARTPARVEEPARMPVRTETAPVRNDDIQRPAASGR